MGVTPAPHLMLHCSELIRSWLKEDYISAQPLWKGNFFHDLVCGSDIQPFSILRGEQGTTIMNRMSDITDRLASAGALLLAVLPLIAMGALGH